jgi:DNA-binding winged helix-turn-helix (wHTH) protein
MESRPPTEREQAAEIAVSGPNGAAPVTVVLSGTRTTVGRLGEVNDIALQPDPQQVVTRAGHCAFERHGSSWFIVDGGSVNGTFIRRGGELERISGQTPLRDGDVVCVLASVDDAGERRFFELEFHAGGDSQATRAVVVAKPAGDEAGCLSYETGEARLVLVRGGVRHEIPIRAQAHRLVRYMSERNAAAGGVPALCTHEELMHAVWDDEPMHSRVELAKLVWELRKKLEPFGAEHLIENERRLGYRLRTCSD